MRQRRKRNRSLCAELLTLEWIDDAGKRTEPAGLEDISATGASVHLDQRLAEGTAVWLHLPGGKYAGTIRHCTWHVTGYTAGIAFADGVRWLREDFEPSHLLDVPTTLSQTGRPS